MKLKNGLVALAIGATAIVASCKNRESCEIQEPLRPKEKIFDNFGVAPCSCYEGSCNVPCFHVTDEGHIKMYWFFTPHRITVDNGQVIDYYSLYE